MTDKLQEEGEGGEGRREGCIIKAHSKLIAPFRCGIISVGVKWEAWKCRRGEGGHLIRRLLLWTFLSRSQRKWCPREIEATTAVLRSRMVRNTAKLFFGGRGYFLWSNPVWLSQIISQKREKRDSVRSSYLGSLDRLLNHLSARRAFQSLGETNGDKEAASVFPLC